MKVKHILTDDVDYCLNFFEEYCIRCGLSYVKLDCEIHFGDSILFFHDINDVIDYRLLCGPFTLDNENMSSLFDLESLQIEKVSIFAKKMIPSSFFIEANGSSDESISFFSDVDPLNDIGSLRNEKVSYPLYREKKYKENTLGYPRKRRKRY